jgi:UDP-glucose 4,6-dehydratase
MILLLGASGYVGRAFAGELRRRGLCFIPLTRRAFDYTRFDFLFDYLRTMRPAFLINTASYKGATGLLGGEGERDKMMASNAALPQMIARVCMMTKTPWGHLSTGSVYCGAKLLQNGSVAVQRSLGTDSLALYAAHPEQFCGFTELDEPNASFRSPPCSFYSGTRALGEEAIRDIGCSYVWRLRLPFTDWEEPSNWLWQMLRHGEARDGINSFSHLQDCAKACLDLWETEAPYGIYNVTNPGTTTTGSVAQAMQRVLRVPVRVRPPEPGDEEESPPSSCVLDCGKLLRAGVKLRGVDEALACSLDGLRRTGRTLRTFATPSHVFPAAVPLT